jgi:hypothetical protein
VVRVTPVFAAVPVVLAVCVVLVLLRLRRTFVSCSQHQVVARPARIAFDAVGRHRIMWLSEAGGESQFRLNTVSFDRYFPAKRSKSFSVGSVTFRKDAATGFGIAEQAGALMFSGPSSPSLLLGRRRDRVALPGSLSPLWLLAGSIATLNAARSGSNNPYSRSLEADSFDRCIDGLLIVAVTAPDQVAQIERSVLDDLPGLARDMLRASGVLQ